MAGCPHIDLTDPGSFKGGMPREAFKYLRNEEPVYWHEDPAQGIGFWAVTRQEELDYISKNPLMFSSAERSCLLMEPEPDNLALMQTQLINMDPPQHLKFRRLVRNAFTPRAVDSYHGRFKEVAEEIVSKAIEGGECEFVEDLAA
jgi:cytochrome P450